jgi:hypothetical protein
MLSDDEVGSCNSSRLGFTLLTYSAGYRRSLTPPNNTGALSNQYEGVIDDALSK